jgi:hypothetical protein
VTSTVARATDPSVRARDRRRRARARFHTDALDCALAGGCARDPRAAEDRSRFLVLGEVLFCSVIIFIIYFYDFILYPRGAPRSARATRVLPHGVHPENPRFRV